MSKAPKHNQAEAPRAVDRAEQVRAVIALMEQGSSENAACEQIGINRGTFRSAALKIGAADEYARACEAIAESQVSALESAIADMRNGTIDASMARVEIDTRKWLASKVLPKRYGDKFSQDAALNRDTAAERAATRRCPRGGRTLDRSAAAGRRRVGPRRRGRARRSPAWSGT